MNSAPAEWDLSADLVVVGFGCAGLAAAITSGRRFDRIYEGFAYSSYFLAYWASL